jgi:antitoxin ParD1/3/4
LAEYANEGKGPKHMVTRNVVLTDAQDSLVQGLVTRGRFQNASEALRAGLRLLEEEEARTEALRDRLAEGLRQDDAGELAEGDAKAVVARAFAKARRAG